MARKPSDTIEPGSTEIPEGLRQLAEVVPRFSGADLEARLQTFDSFLEMLSPSVRPTIATMLRRASKRAVDETSARRIMKAAHDVAAGERAAAPYDHEAAMRAHRAEHRKSFPDLPVSDENDAKLLAKIDEALAQIVPMVEAGWGPAQSTERQLRWCRAYVLDEPREDRPGPFSMGEIAFRAFDMHGDEPELASLITEVERLTTIRLESGDDER